MMPVVLAAACGCQTTLIRPFSSSSRGRVRPVVAVSSFENRSGFAGQWELGTGMADLLVSELIKTEHFVVVERQYLDRVVDEIARQRNRLFRTEGRVDEGKLKNARHLIRGVINDFSQVGGGGIGIMVRSILFMGRGYTARVAMTLTIVDVETGEIVDSIQCTSKVRTREAYASARYKDITFGGDAFFRTPLGTATARAIRQGVEGITEKIPRRRWEPMIAAVEDGQIIVNGGIDRGLRTGQVYQIRGPGRQVTDPATGDLLSVIEGSVIGAIRITDVQKRIAYAEILRGSGFARGQHMLPASGSTP